MQKTDSDDVYRRFNEDEHHEGGSNYSDSSEMTPR